MKRYIKTAEAAEYLSVDQSFLKKNIGHIFEVGVHCYRPTNARLLRWDIEALDAWMHSEASAQSSFADELIAGLFS